MKLPYHIERQVPEFVRENHPAFIEFLKAYYQWYEQEYSIGKIGDLVDIDNTIDEFVQHFRYQLDAAGVLNKIDNRLYLKHIKELYASKGSTLAFKFLFRILFDKESDVILPWEYVLKPSEGKWKQDTSILIKFDTVVTDGTNYNPANLIGTSIYVIDEYYTKYAVFVDNVVQRAANIYELFIERFSPRSFKLVGIETRDGSVTGKCVFTTTSATIQRPGFGFEVGQVFNISSYGGSGTAIKVKSVNAEGGITAIDIIQFGINYETNFNLYISPASLTAGAIPGASISLVGSSTSEGATSATNLSYPTDNDVNAQSDSGMIVRHDYTFVDSAYMNDPTYVGNVVGVFKSTAIIQGDLDANSAQIMFKLGYLLKYPGYYMSSQSIVGDTAFIQDSDYYQVYSYVTSLEETIDSYSNILKKVLHPAGTKHFGTYEVNNVLQPTLRVTPSLNIIDKSDIFRDFIQTSELQVFSISKSAEDVAAATDLFDRIVSYVRTYTDTATTTDSRTFIVTKVASDTAAATDLFDRVVNYVRSYADTASTSDSISFAIETILADTAAATDLFDRVVNYVRSYADTATTSDDKAFAITKSITEAVSTSDVFAAVVNYNRDYSDTTTVVDNKTFTVNKDVTDSATSTDQLTIVSSFARSFNEIASLADISTFGVNTNLQDSFVAGDFILIQPGLGFGDGVAAVDTLSTTTSFVRNYADTANITELSVFDSNKPVADTVTLSDAVVVDLNANRNYSDTATMIDATTISSSCSVQDLATVSHGNVVLSGDKYINDVVAISTSGAVYGNPYVTVLDTVYWQLGYLENERSITN